MLKNLVEENLTIARDNNYEAIELFLLKTIQAFIKLKSTMLIIKLHFSL